MVSFLQPLPVSQVKPPIPQPEPAVSTGAVLPIERTFQDDVVQPAPLPTLIPEPAEELQSVNLPALDQLSISGGVCNVPSGEIPRLDSLLNVESSSQTFESRQSNESSDSSSLDSSESSDSSDIESKARPSSATAQKNISFFGPPH